MNQRKEIAAYVRNHVEFYEERLSLALGWMERDRCPLRMADDKYCEGDYEEQPENFENIDVENITE